MADYHAILKRAISALPAPNGEARRAVYEKARTALVNQLKGFDPPLSPSEITQQRLQLEEAIRKVESEAAKGLLKPTPAAPPVRPPEPIVPAEPAAEAAPETPPSPAPSPEPVVEEAPSREAPPVVPGRTAPTAALKSVVDEAGQLGGAAAELGRQARDALAEAKPEPEPAPAPSFGREDAEPPKKREAADRRRRREAVVQGEKPPSRLPVVIGLTAAILVFAIGIVALWSQREAISAFFGGRGEKVTDVASRATGEKLAPKSTDRLGSDETIKPATPVKSVPTQTITAQPQLQSGDGTPAAPPVPKQAVPLVAQKAILYEEGKAGAAALISQGKVVWQAAPDASAARPDAVVLSMHAEIPERKMVVNLTMRPNGDPTFPASHLVEIKFQLPPDFDGKTVTGVPGLILKGTEQARGDPLNAASAKVAENYFWIALGAPDSDRQRNLKLLKERGWIDIPLLYENGRRAILTLEKADAGDTALADALKAWGQGD
jgi:hypothetical protein